MCFGGSPFQRGGECSIELSSLICPKGVDWPNWRPASLGMLTASGCTNQGALSLFTAFFVWLGYLPLGNCHILAGRRTARSCIVFASPPSLVQGFWGGVSSRGPVLLGRWVSVGCQPGLGPSPLDASLLTATRCANPDG